MALSIPLLTPQIDVEQENYLRMRVFLERATDVLRDVLTRELHKTYPGDFDPSTGILYNVLNIPAVKNNLLQLSRRNVLNASQKQILYPAGAPSITAKVNDFDVTLTVLLLRNITTLNPSAKWDRPLSTDLSTEADIGRVKTYRNNHMHGTARLPAAIFQSDFEGLKTVLLRLSNIYTDQDYGQILIQPMQSSGVPTACQLMSVNLPRKDGNFCGREDLLTEIQQELVEHKTEVFLLTGMGGIGKTSIAVEMGHRMSSEGRDVLFLDMRQVENLDSVRLSLVQHYNPQMFLKEIYDDYQNLFQKALSELNSSTMVIIDSIDKFLRGKKAKQFLELCQDILKASKHISLVCTSRESFDLTSVKVKQKVISNLDVKSSTWLLSGGRSAPQTEEVEILEVIAASCGYCPLALKLLAPQIRKKGGVRMKDKIDRKGVLEVADSSEFEGMKSTFEISFEALTDCEKNMFCSLYIFPVSFHLTDVSNILQKKEGECEDILDSLTSKSLVIQVSDQVYDLHPLLNAFSEAEANQIHGKKSEMEISYCKYYSDMAYMLAAIFENSFPKFASERAAIILPHLLCSGRFLLKHLSKYLQNKSTSTAALDVAVDTADYYFIQRILVITFVLKKMYLFNESLHLLMQLANVLKTKENNVLLKKQTSIHLSSTYERVGSVNFAMGKYDDALEYHKKSLEIREELLGTEHTETADSYNNIGHVLRDMGKYDDALKYFKKGLEIHEEVFGTKHTNIVDSYNNIGLVLRDMGKYNDALLYQMKGLKIREEVLGTKHIKTADSYNNIGAVLHHMGKYDDALNYYNKSIDIFKELLGTQHTATADLYNNICLVLSDMGKYDDALIYQKKKLEICKELLGTQHSATAESYNTIGYLLRVMGKYDDALTNSLESLAIYEKLFGANHIKTAQSYNHIGLVLCDNGKHDDALAYQKKSLKICEEVLGTKHTKTAESYNNIGNVLCVMGKYDDALAYQKKGLKIREEVLGAKHTKTAESYNNIGCVLCDMGKYDDALAYQNKCLKIREEVLGAKHTKTAESYINIGHVLRDMGKYDDALMLHKKGLEIYEESLGTKHIKTAGAYTNIGVVLFLMGKYDDALNYLNKSLEICEELLGTQHTATAHLYNFIGVLLRAMGKYDDALTYSLKSLEIYEVILCPPL